MPSFKKGMSRIFRSWLFHLGFFLTVSLLPLMAMAGNPQNIKEITVAVGQDTAPFYFRDAKGVADGWLVDLWRLWSKKSGIQVKFVLAPFGETLKLTKEGRVDVQGGCFFSEVRAKYLGYVTPLIKANTHFFFHKDIYGIKTLKDLMGFRIGVIKGDFAVDYLRTNLPGAALAEYVNNGDLFEAVKKGEIRAFVIDTPVGLYFLKKMRLLSDFRYFSEKPLYTNDFQAAVKKGDTVLPPVIKTGFDMISPEEKVQIERRWIGSKLIKTKGVLTIACDRYYPPFTMLTPSGQPAGILIDLWRLWSSKNLRKIEFVFGDWKDSVQMVKDGRADFHSGLYKTPERETFLSFSAPVFPVQDSLAYKSIRKPMTLEALSGARVGVIAGTGEESQLREQYPDIIRVPYKGYRELITGLQDGDVVAAYDTGVTLQRVIEDLGLQGEIQVSTEATPIRTLFAGVLKKDASRLKSINSGFAEITEKELRDVEARWVSNPDLRQYSGKARPMVLTFEEKEWLKEHSQIRLGVDPNFMPFEAVSTGGEYEGISASYVSVISKKLDVEMAPVKGLRWQGVIDAVKAGELDVLPCVAKSPKRAEFLQFTRPYLDFQTVAVTRKDAPFIADMKSLKDAQVAVVKGYFVQEMLEQDFPEMKLVLVDDIEQGLKAVNEGQAAAYVDNSASIVYAISKLGLTDLKVAASTGYSSSLRFGVRKDWPQLATILDKALNSIPEEERRNIANRWINVRFAQRTDWAFLIKMGIAVALVIGLILTIIIIWNRRMAKEMVQRKRAEERFEAIAANTPGAIIQLQFNDEGIPEYLYLSAKAEDFFGMPPEQVIQEKERLRWHPEDRNRILETVPGLTAAGEDLNLVGRIQPKGEEALWVRINASSSGSSEGYPIYSGFILDITERKQAEQEYLKSERKIKAMSQAAEDAMVMLDGEGKILFWNPAAERLFGFSESEAMGMDFHQIAAPQVYHDKIYKGLKHFAKNGEGAVLGTTTEITALNREGHEFPVEVTLSSFQVDDEWFAVGTVRDITQRKQAEEMLKESQNRLNMALTASNTGLWDWHPQTGEDYHNEQWFRQLGYEKSDFVNESEALMQLIHPEDKAKFLENTERYSRDNSLEYKNEFRMKAKDGSWKWILSMGQVTERDGAGLPKRIVGVHLDMTERKTSEDRLKFTQTTVDKAALTIFWIDPETGMFTYANDAACSSLGYTREELMGMHVPQIDMEFNEEKFSGLMALLKTRSHVETDGVHRTKDGRMLNVMLSIVLTRLENRWTIAVFSRDETDKKKAEEAMRESERKLKNILETADEGFQLVNTRQEIIDQNPAMCRIMGREKDEVIGKTIFDFVDEENKKIFQEQIELRKQGVSSAYEVALSRPDGSHVDCLLNVSPLFDENKERIGAFAMVSDITERKKAEEAIRKSEQRVQTILNVINTGVIIIDPENRTIVDVNPVAAQMIGLPNNEIIGQTCHQFICPKKMNDCPVLDNDQPVENAERVLVTASGQEMPILKTVTRVDLGGKTHLLESFIDISERKKAEHELNERLDELEQFNRLVVGREVKMISLKEEVNQLLLKIGQEEKYEIVQ